MPHPGPGSLCLDAIAAKVADDRVKSALLYSALAKGRIACGVRLRRPTSVDVKRLMF